MACRLFGAKPLLEAMLTYCQLEPWGHTSVKFNPNTKLFKDKNVLENVVCKMAAILSSERWSNEGFANVGSRLVPLPACRPHFVWPWLRHQIETFSALLALSAGNSPVTGEFPTQRPVTRSFNVFFDLRHSKQSWGWWFETPLCSLLRHCNDETSLIRQRNQCTGRSKLQMNAYNPCLDSLENNCVLRLKCWPCHHVADCVTWFENVSFCGSSEIISAK